MSERAKVSAKRCTKCGQVKRISLFSRRGRHTDQRRSQCTPCRVKYTKRWQRLHPECLRAYRRRQQTHGSPYWRRYAACQLVYWAVVTGYIPRKYNCEKCGIDAKHAKLQRHHPDYDRPLDVVWLCTMCHAKEHPKQLN
jgi:hypothetical protein